MDLRERALSFPRVTQDGDEEGMLIMDRLPTAEEAGAICSYLGINKEREYDDETLARLREKGRQWGDEQRKNSPSREEPVSCPSEGEQAVSQAASGPGRERTTGGAFERWKTRFGRRRGDRGGQLSVLNFRHGWLRYGGRKPPRGSTAA